MASFRFILFAIVFCALVACGRQGVLELPPKPQENEVDKAEQSEKNQPETQKLDKPFFLDILL